MASLKDLIVQGASRFVGIIRAVDAVFTGNVTVPTSRTLQGNIMCAHTLQNGYASVTAFQSGLTTLGSFAGSDQISNVWNNILSVRHRNGITDGNNYGFYLRGNMTTAGSLTYCQQFGGTWQTERTILDSVNYTSYLSDTKTTQSADSTNTWRSVLLSYSSYSAPSTAASSTTNATYQSTNLKYNPSLGALRASIIGASTKVQIGCTDSAVPATISYNSTEKCLDFIFS